jgi:ferredoxin|tara:strand:+ start:109 stop:423 length:315 start_codon:yes stop_codon:yes gene_type:complete
MSYIIGQPCVSTCDTACVAVCPVDCIHGPIDIEGAGAEVANMSKEELVGKMLFINPDECIDCGACLPECPVDAIYDTEEDAIKKDGTDKYVHKNYEFFGLKYEG